MSIRTLAEIRGHVSDITRLTTKDSFINDCINQTIQEINDPSWAFEVGGTKGYHHHWSFNRRKHTLTTVEDQEDYVLPRDVDKIGLIRQTTSPTRIQYIPDWLFYDRLPNPTATGNPSYYRMWEQEGVSTRLTTADTIDVVSSSTSDITQTVSVVGKDSNGAIISEEYSLNGTTSQSGTKTFAADYPIRVSKSSATIGNVTVSENSGSTTLVVLTPEDRSPRFKIISLYPIPSSAISIYLEYYTRLRNLVNNADVPDIDEKWIWVIVEGATAKVYQYGNKESDFANAQAIYASGVRTMVKSDISESDYIPHLESRIEKYGTIVPYSNRGYDSYGLYI